MLGRDSDRITPELTGTQGYDGVFQLYWVSKVITQVMSFPGENRVIFNPMSMTSKHCASKKNNKKKTFLC